MLTIQQESRLKETIDDIIGANADAKKWQELGRSYSGLADVLPNKKTQEFVDLVFCADYCFARAEEIAPAMGV